MDYSNHSFFYTCSTWEDRNVKQSSGTGCQNHWCGSAQSFFFFFFFFSWIHADRTLNIELLKEGLSLPSSKLVATWKQPMENMFPRLYRCDAQHELPEWGNATQVDSFSKVSVYEKWLSPSDSQSYIGNLLLCFFALSCIISFESQKHVDCQRHRPTRCFTKDAKSCKGVGEEKSGSGSGRTTDFGSQVFGKLLMFFLDIIIDQIPTFFWKKIANIDRQGSSKQCKMRSWPGD